MEQYNERLQVLAMLEAGKINADDATKLLLVLGETFCCEGIPERVQVLKMIEGGSITPEEGMKLLYSLCGGVHIADPKFNEKLSEFSTDMKEFAKEFSCKVNVFFKNAQPKIKGFTKTVVSKTANLADNIATSLQEKAEKMDEKPCCESTPSCCETPEEDKSNGAPPEKSE